MESKAEVKLWQTIWMHYSWVVCKQVSSILVQAYFFISANYAVNLYRFDHFLSKEGRYYTCTLMTMQVPHFV